MVDSLLLTVNAFTLRVEFGLIRTNSFTEIGGGCVNQIMRLIEIFIEISELENIINPGRNIFLLPYMRLMDYRLSP